jgi:hypothetical protein
MQLYKFRLPLKLFIQELELSPKDLEAIFTFIANQPDEDIELFNINNQLIRHWVFRNSIPLKYEKVLSKNFPTLFQKIEYLFLHTAPVSFEEELKAFLKKNKESIRQVLLF